MLLNNPDAQSVKAVPSVSLRDTHRDIRGSAFLTVGPLP
jgi:hypothetical protein